MDWSGVDMDRLYELYQRHFDQLRIDVIAVNRSFGSTQPEKSWLERLSRADFESLIAGSKEPEVTRRLVHCVIRGHEDEFPELRVA